MLLFEFDGALLPFTAKTPAFVPLLKLPPRISAPVTRAPYLSLGSDTVPSRLHPHRATVRGEACPNTPLFTNTMV